MVLPLPVEYPYNETVAPFAYSETETMSVGTNMSGNPGALGIDVAATEGQINWDVIAAHVPRVVFAGIRASISWAYQDKWFPANWLGTQNHGILRAAYHVVYPSQSWAEQMNNFFAVLDPRGYGELPCVLDVELDQGQTKTVITNCILNMADYIRIRTGRNPIIYSRASWIDQFTLLGAWRSEFDWWLAQYLDTTKEDTRPPTLPAGVTRWLIHQNADHYPSFGMPQALQMDIDRWNGSEADVYAYANMPPPQPIPTVEQRLSMLETRVAILEAECPKG
jgi:GH25 family lysozyme M1 (1,4-beta-N-acetylmuramidase)